MRARAPPAAPDQEPTGAPTGPTPAPVAEPSAALVRTRSRSLHVSRDAATSRESTPMTSSSRDVPPPQPAVPRLTTPPPQAQPPPRTPADLSSPDIQSPRRVLQPCSLLCGAGVPSLSCAACLCMYHPRCAGLLHGIPQNTFLCKNCRKSDSPPPGPVPVPVPVPVKLAPAAAPPATLPTPRRVPAPPKPNEKRVTLRMKVSGGADGNKVWAVAAPRAVTPRCAALPQSLALINGKRFIVVPRPAPLPLPATPAPSAQ